MVNLNPINLLVSIRHIMNQIESKTRNQLDVKKNNVGKKILHIAGRLTGGINFVRQKGHLRRKGGYKRRLYYGILTIYFIKYIQHA